MCSGGVQAEELQRQLTTASKHSHWDPPLCGDIDIRIARDGIWWHEGREIRRPELVRLFASVLRREADGDHYLVTPVEKWRIAVDDTAFLAVAVERRDGLLSFFNNIDERVEAGAQHPLKVAVDADSGEPHPQLSWRDGLMARLVPSVFYQLVEWGESEPGADGELRVFICSGAERFELGSVATAQTPSI